MKNLHTFVVLAYKESPYLEECLKSVLNQSYKSKVVIATTTDNDYIRALAKKYKIDVVVGGHTNIGGDFDFAIHTGKTELVTVAHQDDIYDSNYSKRMVDLYLKYNDATILFSDYYEIRNDKRVYHNLLLNVKKTLLLPLSIVKSSENKSMKQSCLRFGTAICCPAVSYVPSNIPFDKVFRQDEFVGVADWYGWYKLSNVDNTSFTYIPKPLMGHRVHEGSHTSREIHSDIRSKQELEMFKKFWPEGFAKFLNHFYRKAQYSNELKK